MIESIDWKSIFTPDLSPFELVLRGSIMYLSLFIFLRFVLKRQTGTLGMTDLLLIVLLADASQNAMAGEYKSAGRPHIGGNSHLLELCARLARLSFSITAAVYRTPSASFGQGRRSPEKKYAAGADH
jgi:hypothetical protein